MINSTRAGFSDQISQPCRKTPHRVRPPHDIYLSMTDESFRPYHPSWPWYRVYSYITKILPEGPGKLSTERRELLHEHSQQRRGKGMCGRVASMLLVGEYGIVRLQKRQPAFYMRHARNAGEKPKECDEGERPCRSNL